MPRFNSDYTTVDAVVRQLSKAEPTTPAAVIAEYTDFVTLIKTDIIPQISAYIMRYCDRVFVPYYDTKSFYMTDLLRNTYRGYGRFKPLELLLDEDLMLTSSITWNGTLLSASAYRELDPRNPPYYAIVFDPDNLDTSIDTSDFSNSVDIVGRWGYNTVWTQAFTAIESITVNASATSITVADKTIYEVLQYVKVEDELMQVTALGSGATITVKRGVNGSTAAAHTSASLSKYNINPELKQAATRLASWAYNHRNDIGDRINFSDGSSVITQMPAFVRETLDRLKRFNVAIGI